MKPKELLDYCGNKYYAQAETEKSMWKYLDKDCVVAYDKNKLGVMFIIKGKIKYFGYVAIKSNIYLGGFGFTFRRLELNKVLSLLGNDCIIIDENEFSRIKRQIILENLE